MHGGAYISGTCYHSFWISSRPRRYLALIRDVRSFLLRDPFVFFSLFLFSFLSFFHFVRTESRVGSIRSLKRGHVFEGMWFVLFEGIFYSKQLRRKWFPSRVGSFIPVYFIFSIDYFFSFFFIDSLACFYYSSRSGTIIEKVEKLKFRITFVAIIIILQLLLLLYYIRRINYRSNLDS